MSASELYEKIALISPKVEVILRKLYWSNYGLLKKLRPPRNVKPKAPSKKIDFDKIIEYLKSLGIGEGSLLIVHSSYDALSDTGLSPDQIVDKLLELVGKTGTLAMPVIRRFKGEPKIADILKNENLDDLVCKYNVQKTAVTSGLLPYSLMKRPESVTSRFPLNPLTALGPLAAEMMEHNLEGELEERRPHGKNSSWYYCYQHNAVVVGLGIKLDHYLTIGHVAEEAMKWPVSVENWYRKRKFIIKDKNFETETTVLERKPKWGMLQIADINAYHDLLNNGLLVEKEIEGVIVGFCESKKYIDYRKSRDGNGYPYVISKKYINK